MRLILRKEPSGVPGVTWFQVRHKNFFKHLIFGDVYYGIDEKLALKYIPVVNGKEEQE